MRLTGTLKRDIEYNDERARLCNAQPRHRLSVPTVINQERDFSKARASSARKCVTTP